MEAFLSALGGARPLEERQDHDFVDLYATTIKPIE
jgi:hypothetical protein